MSLRHRIPVDPLPDADWQEVEHAVFAELSAPSDERPRPARAAPRRWIRTVAIVATPVLAVAALAMWLGPPPEAPRLHSSRIDAQGDPVEAQVGEIRLELAAESALVMVGDDARGWVATLERGRVTFAVPPRVARPSFIVQAADARVEVVGTRFTVERDAADGVIVEVAHGAVRVSHHEREARLGPGERFSSGIERAPVEEPAAAARIPLEPRAEGEPTADGLLRRAPGAAAAERERAPVPAASSPTALDEFDRASQLEASDPAQADAIYKRLSERSGPWAPAALFARARLQLDRGDRERAAALLRRYLERYPGG